MISVYNFLPIDNLLTQYLQSKALMNTKQTNQEKPKTSSSQEQEEILVKNLQTGQAENSKDLIKQHSSLIINKQQNAKIWTNYLNSIKKMQDKLLQLVIRKSHNQLKNILSQYPVELSQFRYMDGWTLLHFAVGQNDYTAVETLLNFGIDINLATSGMQRTALHEASLANKSQIVKLLIQQEADPNLVDIDRNSAIHFAVDYGYLEIVKHILQSTIPVDLSLRNIMNMTTYNSCRNPDIFELLIQYDQKSKKATLSSRQSTTASVSKKLGHNYQSRLIIRNSDVLPCTTRADMVQKFLSLREAPLQKKCSNDVDSIISQESLGQSLQDGQSSPSQIGNKRKRIGSYLKNKSILRSRRKASQNVGLVKQSIFMTYLEGKQNVDNFDVLRKLGQGSFAQVFLVRRKQSSNLYALKKIDKKLIIEHNLKRYIEAQKEVLIQVKHPFIIQVYSCLQDFTHLYILLQFCEHGDLQKIVREEKLTEQIAKSYACEVALALQEIHKNGFLYRDLKASNILVDKEGHLRLSDFGLAKHANYSESFLGSVSYMAPQMLVEDQAKPHTKSLDWYLFGILIFQMIHGYPPFYCQDRQEMQYKIKNKDPQFKQGLSQDVKQLILKLLQKSPSKRVQSLASLKQFSWFQGIDWNSILSRKGQVLQLPKLDLKELRRKAYYESDQEKVIDQKIEWFDTWNYPKET